MSTESLSPRIADLVEAAATRQPDAPALVVTAERAADQLPRFGPAGRRPGRPADGGRSAARAIGSALRAGSNAEFVVGLLAASRADLIVVPLDPALPVGEQNARSEAAGARVVLVDGDAGRHRGPNAVRGRSR